MPLVSSVASALRQGGEALTLRQFTGGTFNTTTQSYSVAQTIVNTSIYGVVEPLSEAGIDGVTTKRGDLVVWIPKITLDLSSVTPVVGNHLVRGSQVLVVLEVDTQAVAGYYRVNARSAS